MPLFYLITLTTVIFSVKLQFQLLRSTVAKTFYYLSLPRNCLVLQDISRYSPMFILSLLIRGPAIKAVCPLT